MKLIDSLKSAIEINKGVELKIECALKNIKSREPDPILMGDLISLLQTMAQDTEQINMLLDCED
jgi:hypothetical protein